MHGNEGFGQRFFLDKTFSAEWVGESRVVNAAIESRCCLDVKKELAQYEKIIQYKINSQSLEDAKLDHLDHFGEGARDT